MSRKHTDDLLKFITGFLIVQHCYDVLSSFHHCTIRGRLPNFNTTKNRHSTPRMYDDYNNIIYNYAQSVSHVQPCFQNVGTLCKLEIKNRMR